MAASGVSERYVGTAAGGEALFIDPKSEYQVFLGTLGPGRAYHGRPEILDHLVIPLEDDREAILKAQLSDTAVLPVSPTGDEAGPNKSQQKQESYFRVTFGTPGGMSPMLEGMAAAWIEATGAVADLEAELSQTTVDSPWRGRLETLLASQRRRLLVLEIERRRWLGA